MEQLKTALFSGSIVFVDIKDKDQARDVLEKCQEADFKEPHSQIEEQMMQLGIQMERDDMNIDNYLEALDENEDINDVYVALRAEDDEVEVTYANWTTLNEKIGDRIKKANKAAYVFMDKKDFDDFYNGKGDIEKYFDEHFFTRAKVAEELSKTIIDCGRDLKKAHKAQKLLSEYGLFWREGQNALDFEVNEEYDEDGDPFYGLALDDQGRIATQYFDIGMSDEKVRKNAAEVGVEVISVDDLAERLKNVLLVA